MAGLNLGTGFRGSAVGSLYGGYNGAGVPAASTVPEGPSTITQQGFGVPPAGGQPSRGLHAAAIGTGALILLFVIWWTLPRLPRERKNGHEVLIRFIPTRSGRLLDFPTLHRYGEYRTQ